MSEEQREKVNISFSATSFDLFCLCPARYNFGQNMKKTLPIINKARSLDIGGIGHVGLESYYKDLMAQISYKERLDKAITSMMTKAADVSDCNIDDDDLTILINTFKLNTEFWRHQDEMMEILGVEEPFDYLLFEDSYLRILISGKIDMRVNIPPIGGQSEYLNLPVDHKFHSRDFPVLRTSNQFINYCIPTESNWLWVNRIGTQKTLKPEEKFKRVPVSYDADFIESWKNDVIATILNSYVNCVASGHWPTNYTSCYKFNRLCEFHRLCDTSGEEARQWKLDTEYVDRTPHDKYKEDGE